MNYEKCFPSQFLKCADLDGEDVVATIASVTLEEIGQGRDKQHKLLIKFKELDKGLVANRTNSGIIAKVCGSDDTEDWIGKRITLYPAEVEFKGDLVDAIRVRSKAPAQPQRPQPTSNGQVLSFAQAIDLCATVGVSAEDLKGYLRTNGFTAYNSVACTPLVRKLVQGLEAPPPPPPEREPGDEDISF